MNNKFNTKTKIALGLLIMGLIIFSYWIHLNFEKAVLENSVDKNNNISYDFPVDNSENILIQILEYEISNANLPEGSVCVNYSRYYNKTLSEKYPFLDIRWLRKIDLYNNLTLGDKYHTFLVVNGFEMECILDQHFYMCMDIKQGKVYSNGY